MNTEATKSTVANGILIISRLVMSMVNEILESSESSTILSLEVHILSDLSGEKAEKKSVQPFTASLR